MTLKTMPKFGNGKDNVQKTKDKLYKIKKEGKQKHFSLLCSNISRASEVALIDNTAFKLLKKTTPGHYTFIFEATKNLSKLIHK